MAKGSGRHFRDKSRGKPQRKRKPVVLLIAEGQNKTEKLYFQHFSTPESKYAVKVVSRGETDPQVMLDTLKRECLKDDVSAGDDIERCRAKERQYKDRNWPSVDCNPRTDVASLVEMLAGSVQLLMVDLSFGVQPFHHCRSNLFDDTGAPVWRLNLHKSNAANERLADGLRYGRDDPWRIASGQDTLILTA